jgi:hypothetical protein
VKIKWVKHGKATNQKMLMQPGKMWFKPGIHMVSQSKLGIDGIDDHLKGIWLLIKKWGAGCNHFIRLCICLNIYIYIYIHHGNPWDVMG